MAINSVSDLRLAAISNAGVFNATFLRAPKSVTYGGRTYLRDSAQTAEQRLWYLAAAAQSNPSAIANIAAGSFSLDECYGLDPDRSSLDETERELRAAKSKVTKAQGAVTAMRGKIRDAEARLRDAIAKQKEAQKVQVGDIFTLGISAAGRNLYADGQVQIWKDRIESMKSGSLVGMAGQEGWQIPLNAGLTQLEAALIEARAEERAATQAVQEARRAYDAEARRLRQEEERARQEAARDEAERQRLEAEAAARDAQAAGSAEPSYETPPSDWNMPDTDPSAYVTTEEEYEEEPIYASEEDVYAEELDTARAMFADENDARAYAEDVLGVDAEGLGATYESAYSLDRYYGGDCGGQCDGHCATCDAVGSLRMELLDSAFHADKLGDDDEQGASGRGMSPPPMPPPSFTGAADRPFDFMSIIPVIIAAVLALAPMILKSFMPPTSTHEATPPPAVQAEIAPPPASKRPEGASTEEKLAVGIGFAALLKFLA